MTSPGSVAQPTEEAGNILSSPRRIKVPAISLLTEPDMSLNKLIQNR